MQRICIKNNGPVSDFEMEIRKFNLLIGEQATGKSTVAKSVYYFKTIKTKIIDYLIQVCDTNSYNDRSQEHVWFDRALKSELKDIFVRLFGYSWDLSPQFYMKYDFTEDIFIKVALKQGEGIRRYISVEYSETLFYSLKELQREIRTIYHSNEGVVRTSLALGNEERRRNHDMIVKKVNEIFGDSKEIYYIPAGRSLLTVMSNSRAIMNSAVALDFITEKFMELIDSVRNSFKQGVRKAHLYYPVEKRLFDVNRIADMIVDIEKGEYFYNSGREILKIKGSEHPIEINFTSSGQQEVLWLLNFIYILLLRQEDAFVIIEEPEAHIYPSLQKELIEFIVMFANIQNSEVFITTHSPYVLTAANNLYYAGVLSEEGQAKDVSKIINKNHMIRKGELSAYKLLNPQNDSDKKRYTEVLDEAGREIKSELIDDVSSNINEMYTALYNIELDKE